MLTTLWSTVMLTPLWPTVNTTRRNQHVPQTVPANKTVKPIHTSWSSFFLGESQDDPIQVTNRTGWFLMQPSINFIHSIKSNMYIE